MHVTKNLKFPAIVQTSMVNKFEQDACEGVHSACQNKNGHKAVTRAFIGGGVYSLISVLPNELLFKSVIIGIPSKAKLFSRLFAGRFTNF